VDLDEATGTLRWWGAEKPRAGVPPYAQTGGGIDQPVPDFLRSGQPSFDCPPAIEAEVRAAAEEWALLAKRG
jgi:hypothetical protein